MPRLGFIDPGDRKEQVRRLPGGVEIKWIIYTAGRRADGERYSYVLEPRTGYAVSNGVVSVSILADSCTFADGMATAVMVMGHEKGMELVDRLDNTA